MDDAYIDVVVRFEAWSGWLPMVVDCRGAEVFRGEIQPSAQLAMDCALAEIERLRRHYQGMN